jgi:AraC-like DNA-binding protein
LDTTSRTKVRSGTIKVRNAFAILGTLAEFGADADAVLRRAGLDPVLFSNLENVMTFAALGRLVAECVKATGREDFGLQVGIRMRPTAVGLTGLAAMHAPTVREALQIINASLKTSNTGAVTVLDVRGDAASFAYVLTTNFESADQVVDAAIAMIFNTMRHLCGPGWRPGLVRLTREPPRNKTPFSRFFAAPIEFAQSTPCIVFEAATLDAPVRDRKPEYATILAPLLEEALANARGDFLSAVRSVIRSQIGGSGLTRDSVCRALGLNARTLNHRLEAFGVTYSGLADEAKFEAAQSLLMKDKRIAEIAEILGFAEPSAFTRAFKAWSGATPGRWRAERSGVR